MSSICRSSLMTLRSRRDMRVEVLWNPTDDDFEPKPARLFRRGVDFALRALEWPEAKVYIHCAAGIHRAPMMTLAVLGAMGWELEDAMELIEGKVRWQIWPRFMWRAWRSFWRRVIGAERFPHHESYGGTSGLIISRPKSPLPANSAGSGIPSSTLRMIDVPHIGSRRDMTE